MSCNLRAFSSLAAKRRYTLKSPALAILKLNMYGGCTRRHNNVGGVTAGQAPHNSSNVGGVTAGQAPHNSSNVGGVTAGQAWHNSCVDSVY